MKVIQIIILLIYPITGFCIPITYEFTGNVTRFGAIGASGDIAELESGYSVGDSVKYQISVDTDRFGYRLLGNAIQYFSGFSTPVVRVDRFYTGYIGGDKVPIDGGHGYYTGAYTAYTGESVFAIDPTRTEQTRFDISTGLSITSAFGLNKYIDDLVVGDPFKLTDSWASPTNGNLHFMFGDLVLSRVGDKTLSVPEPSTLLLLLSGLGIVFPRKLKLLLRC